jgi:CheY-like chemotaxis protein
LDLYSVGVLEAENGEEAVDLIVRECPNLVLMNSALPGLDGYEAAQLIRSIRSFDRMPLDFERLDGILENYLFRSDKFS